MTDAMAGADLPELVARARRHASETPDKKFLVFQDGPSIVSLTYADLWARATGFASGLSARGVQQGDLVVLFLPQGADVYAVFLACLMVGARPCIMAPPTPKQDVGTYYANNSVLLDRIGPKLIVTGPDLVQAFCANLPAHASVLAEPSSLAAGEGEAIGADADGIAFLQFSSGTTALKKGVLLPHRSVNAQCRLYAERIGLTQDDVIVTWLPLYHDMGLIACFILPLWAGATVVAMDNYHWLARPRRLLDLAATYRATLMWLPNFAFNYLAQRVSGEACDLSSLRAVINCSEPCRPASHHAFEERFAAWGLRSHVTQTCYAMAEATFAVSQSIIGQPCAEISVDPDALDKGEVVVTTPDTGMRLISSGVPLPGFDLTLVDDNRMPLGAGRLGEIAIRGPSLAEGYFRDVDTTARLFTADGLYYTRDLGFMHEGQLYVLGRQDDVLIVFGRKLRAPELESALGGIPGIKPGRLIVLGRAGDSIGTNELYLLYEPENPDSAAEDIAFAARGILLSTAGLSFRQIFRVDAGSLIKTTSGKISRSANGRLLTQLIAAGETT
ncbi:MAG: AMP-binding protein [Hyphomonadaceae bacterium]